MGVVGRTIRKPWQKRLPVGYGGLGGFAGLDLMFSSSVYALNGPYSSQFPTGWSFSRTDTNGTATALTNAGVVVPFATSIPRITDRGLLVEESRTNLNQYSDDLTNAYWSLTSASASLVTDGTMGLVSRIVSTASTSSVYATRPSVAVDGTTVVRSALIKADGSTGVHLRSTHATSGGWGGVSLNLLTGAATVQGAATSVGATPLAGGWFYVWFVMATTSDGLTQSTTIRLINGNADPVGSGVLVKAINTQVGSFPTSPIITTGAAGTRGADNASLAYSIPAGQDFTESGEVQLTQETDGSDRILLDVNAGAVANRFYIARTGSVTFRAVVVIGSVPTNFNVVGKGAPRTIKWALSRSGDTYTFVVDGALVATNVLPGMPTLTSRRIGSSQTGASVFNDPIRRIQSVNYAMTTAQMQAMTA